MTDWASVASQLLTSATPVVAPGIIGALTALATNTALERFRRTHDRRSLAYALAAEIEEGVAMSERRKYEQYFRNILAQLGAGVNVPVADMTEVQLDPIFSANSSRIGILGPEIAADVVKYHSIAMGIRRDMKTLAKLPPATSPVIVADQIAIKTALIVEDLPLWDEAKAIAVDVIKRLRK